MFNRQFLSLDIHLNKIKLGRFFVKNGVLQILDLETFTTKEELKKYLKAKKLRNIEVMGSIGGVHVIARSISVSSIGNVDFDKEIEKSIKKQLPSSAKDENILMEYQILSTKYDEAKETVDVLVAVAKESAVFEYLDFVGNLKLIPSLLAPGNISIFLPFIEQFEKQGATVIINVSEENTDIVIVRNSLPYFASELDSGAKDFGQSKSSYYNRLSSVLDFYRSEKGSEKDIGKIILTGDASEPLQSYLSKKFDFPVESANFEEIPIINPLGRFEDFSSYAHVIGLGLRSVYPALFDINLIPDDVSEGTRTRMHKRTLKRTFLGFLGALGMIFVVLLSANLFYAIRITMVARKITGIQTKLDTFYDLRAKNAELKDKLSSIEPLIKDEVIWDKMLFEIAKLTPSEVWLQSIKSSSFLEKGQNSNVKRERMVYLEGGAVNQSKVDRFVSKLEDSPIFKSVQIQGMEKREFVAFKLKLTLR